MKDLPLKQPKTIINNVGVLQSTTPASRKRTKMMRESILSQLFSTLCKTPADQPIETKQITHLYKPPRLQIKIWRQTIQTTTQTTMYTYNKFNRRRRGNANIRTLSSRMWPRISKENWKKVRRSSQGKTWRVTVTSMIRLTCPTSSFSSLKPIRQLSEKVSSTILSLWLAAKAKFRNRISKRAISVNNNKINYKIWL